MHGSSVNPIRRPNRVNQVREGSALRPMNDRDSPLAVWQITQKTNAQLEAMNGVIRQLQSQLDRLRLRGGSVSEGGLQTIYKISTIPSGKKDYFLAKTWDGTTLGDTEVAIAKRFYQRPSVTTVTILGTAITYVYSNDNHRTSSDGVNPTQNEELYEPFEVDASTTSGWIVASEVSNATGVVDATGNPVTWMDMTPRVWGKY